MSYLLVLGTLNYFNCH